MKNRLACITLGILLLTVVASTFVTHVNAHPETVVSVFDAETGESSITISEEEYAAATPHTVNVTVSDVLDLYMWQIRLYFDNAVLNCTADMAWYPADHVFAGKSLMQVEPGVYYDADVESWYLIYGCSLVGAEVTFEGIGTLCQINFTGMAVGTSDLTFGELTVDTFLWDSWLDDIEFTVSDGQITVIPELPTFAIMPLLIISTLVAVIIARGKWLNKR